MVLNTTLVNASLHISTETLYIINLVCASLSIVPVCMALFCRLYFIFFMFAVYSMISILYSAIIMEDDDSKNSQALQVFSVLNSVAGVMVALTIGISMGLYKSLFGILRIIWLVIIVTASSSYAFFQTELGASFLPNDVTFIALILSALLLLIAFIVNRLKCCRNESNRSVLPEIFLVLGAFVLRFDSDIEKLLNISFGIAFWNVCCSCSGTVLIIDIQNQHHHVESNI